MTPLKGLWLKALAACVAGACAVNAPGQTAQKEPHIGYLYPAGGQQGTVVQVIAGGQFLKGASEVYVTGEGVRASVVRFTPSLRPLNGPQLVEIYQRLNELRAQQGAVSAEGSGAAAFPKKEDIAAKRAMDAAQTRDKFAAAKAKAAATPGANASGDTNSKAKDLKAHPFMENLEERNLPELELVAAEYVSFNKRQQNAQIAETTLLEVTIAPGAATGDRELRIKSPAGLTNPLRFQVGRLPEIREREAIGPQGSGSQTKGSQAKGSQAKGQKGSGLQVSNQKLSASPALVLPVMLNGQIMPGDVDRFRLRARRGQRLVIEAQARRLMPYLADAVPGWFQATLALYNAKGEEVAFDDDYKFVPDPVLFYEVAEDGEYEVEIRDAIYRGRQDFVYRVAVGEQPFITRMFPLGGHVGAATVASIAGWNLPEKRLALDTESGPEGIRWIAAGQLDRLSNSVPYAVDALPECDESEPNDTLKKAQKAVLPQIINGQIARPGDVDVFRFDGRAGDEVVAEVEARRLHSPLDSLLRLTGASGNVVAWNDDCEDKGEGWLTHHADSYLRARLPEDGAYDVQLSDAQSHGGDEYGYRLRLSPPQPDFALRLTPSSITVPTGRAVALCVYALRKDGFSGDIALTLKDAPLGFKLAGARIPGGRDRVRMTLTAPGRPFDRPLVLRLEGRAQIGGKTVSRPVVPAEDMMQAFAYRHLVPSQELMAAVIGFKRNDAPMELARGGAVRIPAGGAARMRANIPNNLKRENVQLALSEPPKGVSLEDVTTASGVLAFSLKADAKALEPGFADNLIVEAFVERTISSKGAKVANAKPQRVSLGVLPAIPFEIVQK